MNGEPLVILLVEDNMDHAELFLRCFEENRISNRVLHVTDGEAALNYLYGVEQSANRSEHPLPNLLLHDLRLPKIDGVHVLLRIKQHERLKHIPVVVLSSSESEKDMIAAYDSYVNSYVIKPLEYERFISLMKELNFYWIGWNKVPY